MYLFLVSFLFAFNALVTGDNFFYKSVKMVVFCFKIYSPCNFCIDYYGGTLIFKYIYFHMS